jgi:hypothetical protein
MGRISSAVRMIDGRIDDVISCYAKASLFCYLGVIDGKRMFYALTTSGIIIASTTL